MRNNVSGWKTLILVTCCIVNGRFFLPNAMQSLQTFLGLRGLSNTQRRVLQMGDWYRVILALENQIPLKATVRLVSPAPPWYLAYYLYPRLLKKGSEVLSNENAVRSAFPEDWVLVYAEDPPQAKVFPPSKVRPL